MRQKSVNQKPSSERIVKDIRRSVSCWTACGVLGYHRSRQLDRLLNQRLRLAEEFQRRVVALRGILLAGGLGCKTDLSEMASRVQSTIGIHVARKAIDEAQTPGTRWCSKGSTGQVSARRVGRPQRDVRVRRQEDGRQFGLRPYRHL